MLQAMDDQAAEPLVCDPYFEHTEPLTLNSDCSYAGQEISTATRTFGVGLARVVEALVFAVVVCVPTVVGLAISSAATADPGPPGRGARAARRTSARMGARDRRAD